MTKPVVASTQAKEAAAYLAARPGAIPFKVSQNVTMYKVGGRSSRSTW
jgi:hypothetical protein